MRTPLAFVVMLLLISFSCNRLTTTTYGWQSASPEFDDVMTEVEWAYNNFAPNDSMRLLIARLDSIANGANNNRRLMQARTHYWRARWLDRMGEANSAKKEAAKALALSDSAKYYQDFLRMKLLAAKADPANDQADYYSLNIECLSYARKTDNNALAAIVSINLGLLYEDLGEYDVAEKYQALADSFSLLLHFDKMEVKNRVNHARLLEFKGQIDKADSVKMSIINHPYILEDAQTHEIIQRNLFLTTQDTSYLMESLRQLKSQPQSNGLQAFYYAMLCNWTYYNQSDSLKSLKLQNLYSGKAMDLLPYVDNLDHRAFILMTRSVCMELLNNLDSAYIYRIQYEIALDSVRGSRNIGKMQKQSALWEIDALESGHKLSNMRRNVIIGCVIAFILIAGAATFVWYRMHMRMRALQTALELRKANRKVAASALTIEDKDKMLGEVQSELEALQQRGQIDEVRGRKLQSTIKQHIAEKESDETFRESFDIVHPEFAKRLREIWPGVNESYVRLASYILMGLDSNRIARLMSIEYKSVYQLRWILRKHLGVKGKDSLEEALRRLNGD